MLGVLAMVILSSGMFFALASNEEAVEALKESGVTVSNADLLKAGVPATVSVVAAVGMLIRMVTRPRPQSSALTLVERWLFARADTVSRRKRRQAEMDMWRDQIVRETYAQVMEQQERGMLCSNCKGRDLCSHCKGQAPGHRKSA
ncbi:hypothetical protein ACIBCS_27980 [Streptomyces phaeochromogenes]|uniref:hypothetical protein n=1 Tax=Streptomyces phaeochromogenes TaxID=1923 RepID=UPI0033F0F06A